MEIIDSYLPRTEFSSYEDFKDNFTLNVPDNFDFARDVVDRWAAAEPERTALLCCDDDGLERRVGFGELADLSRRAATYFLELGIAPGDRVLTLLRRRMEYWICAVALHRIGAVVVPASVQLTRKDIAFRVESAEVKMIIALGDPFVLGQIEGLRNDCPTLREICVVGERLPVGCRDFCGEYIKCAPHCGYSGLTNSDEMLVYFTSGTSGYPKMAIHDRTYPLGHIVTAKYMQRVQSGRLHLTQSDSGWAKFGWGNIYGQWICGAGILAYDPVRFSSSGLLRAIEKYQPCSLCVPPTMYRFLLRDGASAKQLQSIEWYSTAGEPLSGEVNSRWNGITGQYIHEGFGQSESTPITCTFEWLEVRPSSMGRPSPLYDVAIIRPDGSRCEPGERGEVVIFTHGKKQVGLLSAYRSAGGIELPAADGIYRTGDIACADSEGYFWYAGRGDDMLKCSGYRIGPFEIESVLNSHPAVRESAIIGAPDPVRGQVVCAVLALHKGYEGSDSLTRELQDFVKRSTAPYKYPRIIRYVDSLPKTSSGKIIRRGLLEYCDRLPSLSTACR